MSQPDQVDPPLVLVTTAFLSPGDEVDRLLRAEGFAVTHSPQFANLETAERAALLRDVTAIVAGTQPLTAEMIESAPRLRVIARTGVGYDNVDVEAASRRDIAVCTTPGANRESVAELVFALMLACARGLVADVESVRRGEWPQRTGRELSGSTLGIVGLGSIGKTVATVARGFGMTVIAFDPYFDGQFAEANAVRSVDLTELLRESDFVTLHLFLDDSTRHLIDAKALASMKPGSFLINTSRGGVIDEGALVDAVRDGVIAGAALDVYEVEPLGPDSPLRDVPSILTSGHIAGATQEARARSGQAAARAVIEALTGGAVSHVVNQSEIAALGPAARRGT